MDSLIHPIMLGVLYATTFVAAFLWAALLASTRMLERDERLAIEPRRNAAAAPLAQPQDGYSPRR